MEIPERYFRLIFPINKYHQWYLKEHAISYSNSRHESRECEHYVTLKIRTAPKGSRLDRGNREFPFRFALSIPVIRQMQFYARLIIFTKRIRLIPRRCTTMRLYYYPRMMHPREISTCQLDGIIWKIPFNRIYSNNTFESSILMILELTGLLQYFSKLLSNFLSGFG